MVQKTSINADRLRSLLFPHSDVTQTELASRIGCNRIYLNQCIREKKMAAGMIDAIGKALDVAPGYLTDDLREPITYSAYKYMELRATTKDRVSLMNDFLIYMDRDPDGFSDSWKSGAFTVLEDTLGRLIQAYDRSSDGM